jgi:putative sterol carrier protein
MGAIFNPKGAVGLEAVLQFDFSDIGESYQFEIADGKCELRAGSALAATTKIVVPFSTWKRISDGELSGEEALMKGAYRVEGDFKLMMRMNEIFGRSQAEDAAPKAKKKPNLMALAFVPWYFGWFLGGTSFLLGQAAPFVVSLAFLAYRERHHEATWFERGTPLAFAFLSMLSLAAPEAFASRWNGLANAAIALVWASSLVYGRPLTADYSKGDYSASVASGSIFSRVNVLLTAVWCVLFGLCAAAGLFLTGMSQGRLSIGSAILLIPAGIFTAWFPRWYPGHLARRGSQKSPSA